MARAEKPVRAADLRCRMRHGVVVAELSGEIDMANADELHGAMAAATSNQALGLVIDLTDVEYLDSAGIHMVYRLRDALRAHGQRLGLVVPATSTINDALRLAGIGWGGAISASVEEALQALLAREVNRAEGREGHGASRRMDHPPRPSGS